MSTLIAYATKHGMTGDYARAMAQTIGADTSLADLASRQAADIDLSRFDSVILGGSVYAGNPRSALTKFIRKHETELAGKKLGLFLCGNAGPEDGAPTLAKAFPESLSKTAACTAYLPGAIDPAKLNGFERFIIRMVEKAEAEKGKQPPKKPDVASEAAAFVKSCGF